LETDRTFTLDRSKSWDFDAGLLPLDFTNTAEWHASPMPSERLNSYADLVGWSWRAGLLTEEEALTLLDRAKARPAAAEAALEEALGLREAIYIVFSSQAAGTRPPEGSLSQLNRALADALSRSTIQPAEDGFSWEWTEEGNGLTRMLWPILRSTAELLTSDELKRIGECADDRGCGYLFYDGSRNHSRRWCSMESCGNRAKARRHYRRAKREDEAPIAE
jgi:predicted RNA-binding Zn ribbon-like protein